MVKLNASLLRYLSEEDFRALTALELCMRNHDIVPASLIEKVANLPRGGVEKRLRQLLRYTLIRHDRSLYDGYSLKYSGYDYLALHTFAQRSVLFGFGNAVACGKESDVYLASDIDNNMLIVKLERLGRRSFRSVTRNRSYVKKGKRGGASWFYLSRLAALREFSFMRALYNEGFRVPKPIDHNRHAIVMECIEGVVLCNMKTLRDPNKTFHECMDIIVQLAEASLIHCDFNEFNLLVTVEKEEVVLIDFPQMVSTSHPNAEAYFDRDVQCVHTYFERRYGLTFDRKPKLSEIQQTGNLYDVVMKGDWRQEHEKEFRSLVEGEGGEWTLHDSSESEDKDSQEAEEEEDDCDEEISDKETNDVRTSTEPIRAASIEAIKPRPTVEEIKKAFQGITINASDIRSQLKKEAKKAQIKEIKRKIGK